MNKELLKIELFELYKIKQSILNSKYLSNDEVEDYLKGIDKDILSLREEIRKL